MIGKNASMILCGLTVLVLIAASTTASPATEERVVREEWAIQLLLGSEMGHTHTVTRRVEIDGAPHLRTIATADIEMKRGGARMEMSTSVETVETLDGSFVSSRSVTLMSQQETVTEARVDGERLIVRQTVYGNTTEREMPWQPGVVGDCGGRSVVRSHLDSPGATFEYKTFMPDFGARIVVVNGRVVGPVDKEILGVTHKTIEVHETYDALPGLVARSWFNPDGERLMQTIPIAGGVSTILVSKERALSSEPGEMDALIELAAPCSIRMPYPYSTESALYEVEVTEGSPQELARILKSDRQSVLKTQGNRVWFHTRSVTGDPDKSYPIPFESNSEFHDYLVGNNWLQSDDPAMRAAAAAVIGDEIDALAAAKKLETWVYETIRDKNMTVGFASAKEVLDNPSGDCSEHAVLLAAALRAVGIPARVSMGLLYWNQKFAGHAWAEAWVGEWVPLDGTMARPFVSAAHIDLGQSSLNDEGIEELFLGLSGVIGNLSMIHVHELEQGGKTIRVDADFRPYSVSTVYENELFGFRITQPHGWVFDKLDEVGFGKVLLEIRDEDGDGKIHLRTMALPYNSDFANIVESLVAGREVKSKKTLDLDGRVGEMVALVDDDGSVDLTCVVSDGELLFLFVCRNASDEDAAVFDQALATVAWTD